MVACLRHALLTGPCTSLATSRCLRQMDLILRYTQRSNYFPLLCESVLFNHDVFNCSLKMSDRLLKAIVYLSMCVFFLSLSVTWHWCFILKFCFRNNPSGSGGIKWYQDTSKKSGTVLFITATFFYY